LIRVFHAARMPSSNRRATLRVVLRDVRRLAVPELDAFHTQVDVCTPVLRVRSYCGKNVASDFGLLHHASPFLQHCRWSELTIVLEGSGRFEEEGRRAWLAPRVVVLSDQGRAGTEAFAGTRSRCLVIDWEACAVGAAIHNPFRVEAIEPRDLQRIDDASQMLAGPRAAEAVGVILCVLRSWGLDLAQDIDLGSTLEEAADARLYAACGAQLASLAARPAIQDLVDELESNERQVHREIQRIARRYALPFAHWRGALHQARLVQALRLLAAPGATTERVARLTGFRAPSALCQAFAKGGLPSPGVLAQAARRDVLASWAELVPSMGSGRLAT
jgi:hypothetical protein